MPTQWSGTIEERLARLEQSGRRCDGNSRHCTRAAVEVYDLLPADGFGHPVPDAEKVSKKSCSYHRLQFLENGMWRVVGNRQLALKPSGQPKYRPEKSQEG